MNRIYFVVVFFLFSFNIFSMDVRFSDKLPTITPYEEILTDIKIEPLTNYSEQFVYSLVKLVYGKDIPSFKSYYKVNYYDNIIYGKLEDQSKWVVTKNREKTFAYGSYLPLSKEEIVDISNKLIKEVKGIDGIDLRLTEIDIAKSKVIEKHAHSKVDERVAFVRSCFVQHISDIPIGMNKGRLCFFIYPDRQVWTITSTLIKEVGTGEMKKLLSFSDVYTVFIGKIIQKEEEYLDSIEISSPGIFYKIVDNRLVIVYSIDITKISKTGEIYTETRISPATW